ncbi:MAG: dethiobiotin synthase [Epsilonproteobacteria bacterium]|nr:dethiobiotin synthase [Campylobacterota bacterium]
MKNIFVTATNTDIGKTYATTILIKKLAQSGLNVGAFKPIETGVITAPQDGLKLLKAVQEHNPNFKKITIDDIVPIQFSLPAAPYIAKKEERIDFDKIEKAYKKITSYSDIVLIEGAGGLLVPIEEDLFMIDLISHFNAHTLLITHDKLGSINDTLLSLEALNTRGLEYTWCINQRHDRDDFQTITLPYYLKHFKTIYTLQENIDQITQRLITYGHTHRDT